MKIRAQIGMVLNLDKCIGCHTCSVTCKNVWTNRPGMEYAWFNNVETKPGIGYPKEWENQDKWNGGWIRKTNGQIEPRQGDECAGNTGGGPEGGPQPFPQESGLGQDSLRVRRRLARAAQALRQERHQRRRAPRPSQAGTRSCAISASAPMRGRTTAWRLPSTRISGTSGRVL